MADAARAQRQAALEEKKRRLEELKARKQQRATTNVSAQAQVRIQASANLDDYIDGLLQVPAAANAAASDLSTIAANNSGAASKTVDENGSRTNANQPAPASEGSSVSSSAPAPAMALQPKAEVFEMGTQTSDDDFPLSDDGRDGEGVQQQTGDQQENKASRVDVTTDETVEEETSEEAKVLTAEEVEKELSSEAFSSFLNATSKKVERVLGSDLLADLLVDYDGKSDGSKRITTKTSDGSKYLSSRQIYECPKWTGSRDVTDMDWSPLHRELMLCGYHMRSSSSSLAQPLGSAATKVVSPDDTPSDSLNPRSGELLSDGLALVWNLAMPSRPEHIFTCGSPVTTVRFHPTEANLIIGGCQSGQVVVWDVRAGRMPVQKSVLTTTASGNSKGHTHPICAMEVIEGGAGLVTAATDGRVNFWSLANLRDPAESLQTGESVSCLAVSPDSETIVCGDDMGTIYAIQSSNASLGGGGGQRSRRQVRKLDSGSESHYGMISSLATKTLKSTAQRAGITKGFLRGSGGLLLSSGVDWTVKMWAPAYTDKPLLSLMSHSYDYMSDAQWSPGHASLMATASSNGTVGLWNFALSLEEPITGSDGIVVEPDGGSGRGLNKLKWSSDGRRMLAASADRVHVLVLSEDVVRQKGDEDAKMMNHLTSRGLLDRE